jgi:hypothetical protein
VLCINLYAIVFLLLGENIRSNGRTHPSLLLFFALVKNFLREREDMLIFSNSQGERRYLQGR